MFGRRDRRRRLLLLGVCPLLLMTLGADKPQGRVALEIKGYIVPVRQVTVSARVSGEVIALMFEEGQKVKKGDVLARLDALEYEGALALARAGLKLAEARVAKAKEKEAESKADVFIAQAEVEVAKARVHLAQQRLDYAVIRAPVSGTVLAKRAEVGASLQPGAGLCDLADLQALEVELWVMEKDLALIKKGQKCVVRPAGSPRASYQGRVERILPVADRARGAVGVRVRLEVPAGDDRLRPDLSAIVQIWDKE